MYLEKTHMISKEVKEDCITGLKVCCLMIPILSKDLSKNIQCHV